LTTWFGRVVDVTDVEPIGPSEFSWGRGQMPNPEDGGVPKGRDKLRALYRNDQDPTNLDAGAVDNYEPDVRE
jgi:hypothetical protein